MKKVLLMLAFVVGCVGFALAQQLKGTIKDAADGSPLVGASVVVKGTTNGTVTDIDGNFELNVPAGSTTLVVSFVGYKTQDVAYSGQSTLDITLSSGDILNEVVVVGYGSQTKREVSGSIAKVRAEEIENMPVQSFDRALQGRAAGVWVTSASGAPGSAVNVRIRGVGSISAGNEPLYVVDGVQISGTSANNVNNNTTVSNNPLGFLNPNDIESIEVIKDAASAAIYGAAAANGVVLVTTKKGKSGKPRFSVNIYRGQTEQIKKWDVLNSQEYIQMRAEALYNQSRATSTVDLGIDSFRRRVMTELRYPFNADINSVPTYDWQDAASRQGQIQNYEISASGGTDKNTYNISASYNKQDANIINIDFERGTAAMSMTNKLAKWLTLDTRANLSTTTQRGLFGGPGGGSFLGSPAFSAPLVLPSNPIYNEDGTWFGASPNNLAGLLNQNVIQVGTVNNIRSRIDQFVGTFRPIIAITPQLSLTSSVSLDLRNTKSTNYQDATTADAFAVNGRLTEERGENSNFLANSVLNYSNTFAKDHKISGLAGLEYRREAYEEIFTVGTGIASPTFKTLSATAVPVTATGFGTSYKRAGAFGRLQYSYKDRYFLTANIRRDGSSRFGSNFRYGTFSGVSGSWVVTEENFMKGLKFVDFLKIRGGYGRTGNDQIGNFVSRGLFGVGGQIGFTNGVYNGSPAVQFSNLSNPNITWEKNTTAEVGLELGLFKDAIFLDLGYFNRLSSDLLLDRPLPWNNGVGSETRNLGEMVNKGWEAALTLKPIKINNFKWATTFNAAIIDNKVTKLYEGIVKQPTPDSLTLLNLADINGVGITVVEGYPIGSFFSNRYRGVNPATGRPMWLDAEGNPTYIVQARDPKIIGDGFAEIVGGINTSISYGDPKTFGVIGVDFLFQGEFGRLAPDGALGFISENGGRAFNTYQKVYDERWTTPGQITATPRPYNGNAEIRSSTQGTGDRFIRDASYIRLKNFSISYSLPKDLLNRIGLTDLRVYAQGFNLVTWTKWTGLDPEFVNIAGNGTNGQIVPTRNYQAGIQFGF